ncbi:hypothetical protein Tco_0349323 [Tanacetum coccineum]
MHNNIMATGSRDRPLMLATGRYAQWRSLFLRYIDTRPNGDALRKCILEGPYTPIVIIPVVPATDNSLAVLERTTVETVLNMSPENKAHFESEKEEAIERLQQGESLNIQDVKTNLFWDFGKFTSHDGETMESYYTRFYKLMNEMIRNNLTVATMQLFDILKQYQKEVNELHAKRIAKNANPLALVAAAQPYQDPNQGTMTIAGAKETECRKPKRVKDSTYHKEKMLCKHVEKGVPLQAKQSDLLADTDEEIDEQELEAHYSYMVKIQEVPTPDSGTDSEPLEQVQYDTGYNVFANEIQHSEQSESISNTCVVETGDSKVIPDPQDMYDNDIQNDQNAVEFDNERIALANLIANLKLDVDKNKKTQKQLKKANASLTQELTECKSILAETSRTLGESNSIRDSCLVALQNKQTEFERYKNLNDRTVDYDKLEQKLNETLGLLAQKDIDIK